MTAPVSSSPNTDNTLVLLAEELREYTALKYVGDCKCGKCQLVPRDLIDRLYAALRSARAPAPHGGGREAVKAVVIEYLSHRGENPHRILRGGSELWETHVPAMTSALALRPAPTRDGIADAFVAGATAVHEEWVRANERGEGPPRGDPEFGEAASDYASSVRPASPDTGWRPTEQQINSACLSYRHDFGLLPKEERKLVRFKATEWLRAWQKEGMGCDRDEVIERCANVVDQANREGPYQAIAAAPRIRALKSSSTSIPSYSRGGGND